MFTTENRSLFLADELRFRSLWNSTVGSYVTLWSDVACANTSRIYNLIEAAHASTVFRQRGGWLVQWRVLENAGRVRTDLLPALWRTL